ncbi:MAG: S8 family peptidase [Anaerolineae bacterium]
MERKRWGYGQLIHTLIRGSQCVNWTGPFSVLLLVGLLLPGIVLSPPAESALRAQPLLLEMAAEHPDEVVGVIVQKLRQDGDVEALVVGLGGEVTKDLHIINAFAAELPAKAVLDLATAPGVRWVSYDGPVTSAAYVVNQTVRDEFNTASYGGNDGTTAWEGEWVENDAAGVGPAAGNVQIVEGELWLHDNPDTGTQPSMAREVDLSSEVTGATLSFDFSTGAGVEAYEDRIAVDVSSDGGASYTVLEIIDTINAAASGSRKYDISAHISADTMIRFRVFDRYGGPDEYFAVDNVQIDYVSGYIYQLPPENYFLDTLSARQVWDMGLQGDRIGIAVIDSGVTKDGDFGQRIKRQLSFNPNSNTVNDVYGHGTHVAGITGGDGSSSSGTYVGIAPCAQLISLKISDETGMAYESDTVDALQWVFDNKEKYEIRVLNLSVNSVVEQSYHTSPLDAAAEILWFNGIVVVASAGNRGPGGGYNTVDAAPANDPFIITVGASDEHGTADRWDDTVAPFSAYGTTMDGFVKPDIIAPGRDIISVLSQHSSWDDTYPERVVEESYFRLSGTSASAPMVAGAAALLLQDEPDLTPDQVKYRLTHAATDVLGGYPYLDVYAAVTGTTTESANTGIEASQLLWTGDEPVMWDSVNWNSVNWNSVNWNSVNWNSVNWNSVNWNSAHWGD